MYSTQNSTLNPTLQSNQDLEQHPLLRKQQHPQKSTHKPKTPPFEQHPVSNAKAETVAPGCSLLRSRNPKFFSRLGKNLSKGLSGNSTLLDQQVECMCVFTCKNAWLQYH